jgi:hypothetical protein
MRRAKKEKKKERKKKHLWHSNVHENDVKRMLLTRLNRLLAVKRLVHVACQVLRGASAGSVERVRCTRGSKGNQCRAAAWRGRYSRRS